MPHHPRRYNLVVKRCKRVLKIADAPRRGLPAARGIGEETLQALLLDEMINGRGQRIGKVAGIGIIRQTPTVALQIREVRTIRRFGSLSWVVEVRLRLDIERKRFAFEQRLNRVKRFVAVVDVLLQAVPSFL